MLPTRIGTAIMSNTAVPVRRSHTVRKLSSRSVMVERHGEESAVGSDREHGTSDDLTERFAQPDAVATRCDLDQPHHAVLVRGDHGFTVGEHESDVVHERPTLER